MAEKTRYYWLKLNKDFFKRHDIRIIESQPNGKDYVLFYLKLMLESVSHEGSLRFSETIPYNEEMLAIITNTNIDVVRSAMKLFHELKMVEIMDDQTIYMQEVERLIGSETASAGRVRKHREKVKALQCNTIPENCNTEIEIDIEKDKDKEKDKEIEIEEEEKVKKEKPVRHKCGKYGWVQLTNEERDRLKQDLGVEELIRCITYIDEAAQTTGNKNKWKDWNLVIRKCSREGWGLGRSKQNRPNDFETGNPFLEMLEERRGTM